MFVFANFLDAFSRLASYLLTIYMWVIIIRALLSWVNPDPYNPVVRFLSQITEPVMRPIRRRLPSMGGIDISPLIIIFVIMFLQIFLVRSLSDFAMRLRIGG